jgi:glycine/D-amino acid oxidase-like deaminating enzyme
VPATGGWRIVTPAGSLACDTVIVAAGIEMGHLLPALRRRILPFRIHEAATAPSSAESLAGVLERCRALTDTRRLPSGVRRTGDGRLIVTLSGPASGRAPGDLAKGLARLRMLFPALGIDSFAETWSGWVDLAMDQYPRLTEPLPGLLVGYGLSGRGIGLGTALGLALARRARGERAEETGFPDAAERRRDWWPGSRLAVAAAADLIRRIDDRQARRAAPPARSPAIRNGS